MPGRRDFGIVLSSALTDPRVRAAARLYVARKLASKPTALYAVIGHISVLGLNLARDTDDGIVRGTLRDTILAYLAGSTECEAERIAGVLSDPSVDLLRPCRDGHYLVGFADAYAPVVRARELNRERAAKYRAAGSPPRVDNSEQNTSRTGAEQEQNTSRTEVDERNFRSTPPPVGSKHPKRARDAGVTCEASDPFRSVEGSPPPPEDGGRVSLRSPHGDGEAGGTPKPARPPKPLRPRARELLVRKLDYLAATGTEAERNRAVKIRALNRSAPLPDDEIRRMLDSLRWITPERLRRHLSDAKTRPRKPEC